MSESDSDLLAQLLDRMDTGGEGITLEFKSATGGLPRDLWPTVSAFANTNGGWIILGVSQSEDGAPVIQGVGDSARLLQELNNQLRNAQKVSHPVCGAADTQVTDVAGRRLVLVRIPAAARRNKPVYVNGNPYSGTYVRRGEGDYLCQKPEIDRMMREASDATADSAVLAGFTIADLDQGSLNRYRRRYQTQRPESPHNNLDDREFLRAIGAYAVDRERQIEGVTVAGLLLVGKNEALREWRTRHLIDFRVTGPEFAGEGRWIDRIPWEGNLFEAFEVLFPRLTQGLPSPFRLDGETRVESGPVQLALREALVNLLVHADYAEPQASLIVRSPQGFMLRNPGSSRIPESDLFAGTHSDPRNPVLIRMFRMVGFAEEAGTGIPSIIKAWKELGFHLPEINTGTERYEFTLNLRFAHLLSEESRRWLEGLGWGWTEAEQLALVLAKHQGQVDNPGLRRLTGQHATDATKTLVGLRDRGLLDMRGDRRTAHYVLSEHALLEPVPDRTATYELEPDDLAQDNSSLTQDDESLAQGDENLTQLRTDLTPRARVLLEFADEIVLAASEMRRVSLLPKRESREILLKLCQILPMTIQELSSFTFRSPRTLGVLIRELVKDGELELEFPRTPRHPQQRYRRSRV